MAQSLSSAPGTVTLRERGLAALKGSVALPSQFVRSQDGSVTVFSLFMFLMMIFIGGLAVDLMRFETKRAALQNTLDSATLAATNLRSEADAETLVKDFMTKRGYDADIVDVDVFEAYTGADPDTGDPGTLVARSVTADYDMVMDNIFMPLIDENFQTLGTGARGAAEEGMTSVEISLVVDISNSMNLEGRLPALKTAATNFVDQVMVTESDLLPVTISVIPFNHTVVAPNSLLNRMNTREMIDVPASAVSPYGTPVTAYNRTAPNSQCARFEDSHMITVDLEEGVDPALDPNYMQLRALSTTAELDLMAYYARNWGGGGYNDTGVPDNDNNWRCNPNYFPAILPWGSDPTTINTYLNAMVANGNTSADTGLKWGLAMLDPSFRSIVNSMVTATELPDALSGRPFDYDPARFMKVVVLMSDGANTKQHDMKSSLKNGPSTVWYSEMAANDYGPNGENWVNDYIVDINENGTRDRAKQWYDGYYTLREDYSSSQRWLRPHSITNQEDGVLYAASELPEDAVQLTWDQVFERFSLGHSGLLHYDRNVGGAYDAWANIYYGKLDIIDNSDDGEADRRMSGESDDSEFGLCDAAKVGNDILVFTIGFTVTVGSNADNVLRDCATADAYNFNAQNAAALNQAFADIATTLTTLRMTQ